MLFRSGQKGQCVLTFSLSDCDANFDLAANEGEEKTSEPWSVPFFSKPYSDCFQSIVRNKNIFGMVWIVDLIDVVLR